MSMTLQNFQEEVNLIVNMGKANNLPNTGTAPNSMGNILTTLATALSSDLTVHADVIEAPPAALKTNLGR